MKKDKSDMNKVDRLMKLYTSKINGESFGDAEQIKTFSQTGKHISNGSFSEDGTKFLYTICSASNLSASAFSAIGNILI